MIGLMHSFNDGEQEFEDEDIDEADISEDIEEDIMDDDDIVVTQPENVKTVRYSAEEYRAFQSIDRDEEDKLVCQYTKTKSPTVLLRLLNIREQTLRYMARKYAYLDNEDDMYSEFKGVWLKCVKKYRGRGKLRQARDKTGLVFEADGTPKMITSKTPFNTYLYTSMRNRVGNIVKRRHIKRLLDQNGKPVTDTMRSLDYGYGDDSDLTLKDVLADKKATKPSSRAEMADLIKHLGAGDPDIAQTVDTFINNPRFDSLQAACNYKVKSLNISKWDRKILSLGLPKKNKDPIPENVQKAMVYLKQLVDSTGKYSKEYEIVSFILHANRVDFVVHVDDPNVVKKVKEAIVKCRKFYDDQMDDTDE